MCGVRYEGFPGRVWTCNSCQLMSDTLLTDLSLHIHDSTLCHDILRCTNLGSRTEKRPRKVGYDALTKLSYVRIRVHIFQVMQISCFDQKIKHNLNSFCYRKTTSLCIESTTFVSLIHRWHHCSTGVLSAWLVFRNFVIYRGDWLSIKFYENDSFRKLFLFFENAFQYLVGISQDISVSHFDSRRSLSSANRRRPTSPILFVSFTQPCDQHDRKIRTIFKSAARWRGRRARGYRKLILRANLLHVPKIKI